MRPSLGEKPPTPIPDNLQQKNRLEIVSRQIEALHKIRDRICHADKGEGIKDQEKGNIGKERKLRIKENIQILPPYSERKKKREEKETKERKDMGKNKDNEVREEVMDYPEDGEGWEQVNRKRQKKDKIVPRGNEIPRSQGKGKDKVGVKKKDKDKERIKSKKLPKTAAVSIKGKTDAFSYAEALKKARMKISLDDLNIEAPKIRKGINGSTIIEIKEDDNIEKADKLAEKLHEILQEEAYISCPVIKGELRITGLDESVSDEEVKWAIAKEGDCRSHEIHTGAIQRTRSGLGALWIRCPLKAAITVAKIGKIKVGWTVAKVELLQNRPIQCHRCWRQGHVKNACRSIDNFSNYCFQCGQEGHAIVRRNQEGEVIARCRNKPWCILCARDDEKRSQSSRRLCSM